MTFGGCCCWGWLGIGWGVWGVLGCCTELGVSGAAEVGGDGMGIPLPAMLAILRRII